MSITIWNYFFTLPLRSIAEAERGKLLIFSIQQSSVVGYDLPNINPLFAKPVQ